MSFPRNSFDEILINSFWPILTAILSEKCSSRLPAKLFGFGGFRNGSDQPQHIVPKIFQTIKRYFTFDIIGRYDMAMNSLGYI